MNDLTNAVSPSPLEREIAGVRALIDSDNYAAALELLQQPLAMYPENRDVLLLKANCERFLRRTDEALATLDVLAEIHPNFSLMHQERGLCHVARKDAPAALAALQRAVTINPALPLSWQMIEGVSRIAGDQKLAALAATHRASLASIPEIVVEATSLFSDGDMAPAENMVRAFLLQVGEHPEAMRLLAKIGLAHKVYDDAELLLAAVVDMVPDHVAARYEYANCLVFRYKHALARDQLQQLLLTDPQNSDYLTLLSTALVGLGLHEQAIALYRELLIDQPQSPDLHLWQGHALKTTGRLAESVDSYRAAAAARSDFGDAYWSLANLKTYRFTDEEIARMRAEEAKPPEQPEDHQHLCFALGKALEDRGEFADSWLYYERGNSLKRAQSSYRGDIFETNTRKQIEVCAPSFFAARTGWGDPRPDPIFIVGLPRSGSTLLEQILASHSEVEGTQELPDIHRFVQDMHDREIDFDNPRYPGCLPDLTHADIRAYGARYLADTSIYRTDKPNFIDKMPNNFRHIGFVHLILPNARIIDARREPMSCCFSNLKQLFAAGQEFAYGTEDIARYYRTYLDLMQHWDAVLPGRVLRVHHEDVVADLEGSVRRILDHCGLPFEEACVEFHKSKRSVRTPSSEQVRQPIFRDGLDQWKNYEAWLGPLSDALGDAHERYRT
jgi:tetratricopeptide (TPR) repeat protein